MDTFLSLCIHASVVAGLLVKVGLPGRTRTLLERSVEFRENATLFL